jgi:hypothetical protein
MKVISVIDQEAVIYRILAPLHLLPPGDGSRAPPKSSGLRELIYEPVYDLPVGRTQTGAPAGVGLREPICEPVYDLPAASACLPSLGDRQAPAGDLPWAEPA